jgi:hypothetical protein
MGAGAALPQERPSFERERRRAWRPKHVAIDLFEQRPQPALVWGCEHDDARTLVRRKAPVVGVVVIESHEGTSELTREMVVLNVAGAAQVVVLEDEEDIPAECAAHVLDGTRGKVGIGVHARPLDQSRHMRAELG